MTSTMVCNKCGKHIYRCEHVFDKDYRPIQEKEWYCLNHPLYKLLTIIGYSLIAWGLCGLALEAWK